VGYKLYGLGIESQWGERFSMLIRKAPKPNQPRVQWVTSLLQGLKMLEHGAANQPFPSTELQMGRRYTTTSLLCLPTDVMK
jgi:hypothetical protein